MEERVFGAIIVIFVTSIQEATDSETRIGSKAFRPTVANRVFGLVVEILLKLAIGGETVGVVWLKLVGDVVAAAEAKPFTDTVRQVNPKTRLVIKTIRSLRLGRIQITVYPNARKHVPCCLRCDTHH